MMGKGGDENGFCHINRFHGRRDGRKRNGFVPFAAIPDAAAEKEEQRDAVKTKETVLLFQSLKALGKLSVANSIARVTAKQTESWPRRFANLKKRNDRCTIILCRRMRKIIRDKENAAL